MADNGTVSRAIDETARRCFERAWCEGRRESLEHYLPAAEDPRFLGTLAELVLIEIEFAWKAWKQHPLPDQPAARPALVEDYLRRFPALNQPSLVRELLDQEYLARQRHGDRPPLAEYRMRFPSVTVPGMEVKRLLEEEGTPQTLQTTGPLPVPVIPGYEVLSRLAEGGMGTVYRVRQLQPERLAVLKVVRTDQQLSPEYLERFRREAAALARLQNPHIVQIHTAGEVPAGPYFVMEYLEGGSLAGALKKLGKPAPVHAAHLVGVLAWAMEAAHSAGVIHRDLKPANVLLAPSVPGSLSNTVFGFPKIGDFGLARLLDDSQHPTGSSGFPAVGTPAYMAPEQAEGQATASVDIYALGVILYQLLTGRLPFWGGTSWETLDQARQQLPVPPHEICPEVPDRLELICLKCLAKTPAERYPTAAALAEDLRGFLRAELSGATAPPPGPPRLAPVWLWPGALLSLAALLLVGLWLSGVLSTRPAGLNTPAATPTPPPVVRPALKGTLNAWVIKANKPGEPPLRLHQEGVLPLVPGDLLCPEATLNRPGYFYVVWLDSRGKATMLYPMKPEENQRQDRLPLKERKLPEGPSGVETLFLLCREEALPPGEDLLGLFAEEPAQEKKMLLARTVWFEDGVICAAPDRSAPVRLADNNNPVVRTQALLNDKARRLFDHTRAVCVLFLGDD